MKQAALLAAMIVLAILSGTGQAHAVGQASADGPADVGRLIDSVVPGQLEKYGLPGAAVSVVSGGRQVFAKGYGYADLARRTPVDAEHTPFFTASVAKGFTAMAVLQLVGQHKLDLDADVNRYLRTFTIDNTFPGRPVTLRHLLTHTAGFEENVIGTSTADPAATRSLARTVEEDQPERVRPPGTLLAYNNYGYDLAGYLVEVASGLPFDRYLRERVLQPLGMTGTSFAAPLPDRLEQALATGYDGDKPYRPYYGHPASGTGAVTTAADMSRLMIALLDDDPRLGHGIGELMMRRHYTQDKRLTGMGYGVEEMLRNGHRIFFKGGDINGFHHLLAMLPDQRTGIYVVSNGEGAQPALYDLVNRIVDHQFPGRTEAPRPMGGDTSAYAGTYITSRSFGDLLRFGSLINHVTVTSSGDGRITTTGLSRDPAVAAQEWIRIGPGLFAEQGGQERIALSPDGVLAGGHQEEATTFERAPATLYLSLLYSGLAAFVIGVVAIPAVALLRRIRHRPAEHPAAWWLAWVTGVLILPFLYGLAVTIVIAPSDAIFLGSPTLTGALLASSTAFVLTAGVVVCTAGAWWKGWWRLPGRISYTVYMLAAVSFMTVAYLFNLVGGVFA
ncbi:serine hydrolase domain-containing protein [Nonomuraea sp. B1E8]|uniref:serine hydrolase domain-containing protein n=1 Tax=unclassified Nonomuraea TaxID=2593643 RepID=UPI00325E08E3